MPGDPSFELAEDHVFTGRISWHLSGNHVRFRGTDDSGHPRPGSKPAVARNAQLARFVAVLDFLAVWDWLPDYNSAHVRDGISWSFTASIDGRTCKTGGANAFPSFADPSKASLQMERYGLLVLALRATFGIDFDDGFVRPKEPGGGYEV